MRLTPDGSRYLRMAAGGREPMPFHLRWLLPRVLGRSGVAWIVTTWLSLFACSALTALLAQQHGASRVTSAMAALLWLGLPSTRFLAQAPVLVDAPGLAFALGAAVLWPFDARAAVLCAALGAAVSEKTPIWAALFAWQPWPLVALVVPVARRVLVSPGPVREDDPLAKTLAEPLATGLASHRGKWRDPRVMLLPWGAGLAAFVDVELWWAVPVAVAYAQLLVATDTVRLYQNAAPVVCIAAALVLPVEWMAAVLVAHWLNPWMGDGI